MRYYRDTAPASDRRGDAVARRGDIGEKTGGAYIEANRRVCAVWIAICI